MWLYEDKIKGKTANFRLSSASQKRRVLKLPIRNPKTEIFCQYLGQYQLVGARMKNQSVAWKLAKELWKK